MMKVNRLGKWLTLPALLGMIALGSERLSPVNAQISTTPEYISCELEQSGTFENFRREYVLIKVENLGKRAVEKIVDYVPEIVKLESENQGSGPSALVRVPIGLENYYLHELRRFPEVYATDLNPVMEIPGIGEMTGQLSEKDYVPGEIWVSFLEDTPEWQMREVIKYAVPELMSYNEETGVAIVKVPRNWEIDFLLSYDQMKSTECVDLLKPSG